MTDAIGYTRLSQESDRSIDAQKANIREYASANDFELFEIYDDGERASGFETESREEYQRVRDRVADGTVTAVIVNDKRRLSRGFDETMRLILDCRQSGVEIHTYMDGQLDLEDPVGVAIELVQAASEAKAKKKEIERARDAVNERLERGDDHGPPRTGMEYGPDGRQQQPGDDFEKVVKVLQLAEDHTYEEIQRKTGVPTSTANRIVQHREWYEERAGRELRAAGVELATR